jgi:AraC-like DNA-binding protein
LHDKIIPWLKNEGTSRLAYGHQSPSRRALPASVKSRRRPARLSRPQQGKSFTYWKWWPQQGLCKMHCPQLLCVLEGEANYQISDQLLTLPERTFLLVPSGVLCSDGYQPQFGRIQGRATPFRLFWLHFLPEVTICHLSGGSGEQHNGEGYVFVPNTFLTVCANRLNDVLGEAPAAEGTSSARKLAGCLLLTLLLDLERDLTGGKALLGWPSDAPFRQVMRATPVVERACAYINAHLEIAPTLEQIANYVHTSPRHLHRCFQDDIGLSPMQYVSQCRLERARTLLQDSSLSIGAVASIVGYSSASYFTQAFVRAYDMSPTHFRRQQEAEGK